MEKYYKPLSEIVEASTYEVFGFYKEIHLDNRFMGSFLCEYDPTKKIGYAGRCLEVLPEDVYTDKKIRVKKSQQVSTIMYPLCGSVKKKI